MRYRVHIVHPPDLEDGDEKDYMGDIDLSNHLIRISADLNERDFLYTATHEAMHGLFPDLDEGAIERKSRGMANVLWVLGFRHQHLGAKR